MRARTGGTPINSDVDAMAPAGRRIDTYTSTGIHANACRRKFMCHDDASLLSSTCPIANCDGLRRMVPVPTMVLFIAIPVNTANELPEVSD